MFEMVFLQGRDGNGDLCLIPVDCVAWISRFDKNDTDDIFGTHDGEVYTCNGGWQQAVRIYGINPDEDDAGTAGEEYVQ